MQEIINDLVRGLGYVTLRLLTFGRYRGGTSSDLLPEGAIGLAIVAAGFYVAYRLAS